MKWVVLMCVILVIVGVVLGVVVPVSSNSTTSATAPTPAPTEGDPIDFLSSFAPSSLDWQEATGDRAIFAPRRHASPPSVQDEGSREMQDLIDKEIQEDLEQQIEEDFHYFP